MWFSPVRRLMFGLSITLTKKTRSAVKENTKAAAFFVEARVALSSSPVGAHLQTASPVPRDAAACESDGARA
jgi:hypothetical protein